MCREGLVEEAEGPSVYFFKKPHIDRWMIQLLQGDPSTQKSRMMSEVHLRKWWQCHAPLPKMPQIVKLTPVLLIDTR